MRRTPTLAGQLTYFAVRTSANEGALQLAIDRGDGKWRYSKPAVARAFADTSSGRQPEWHIASFATVLERVGLARFGILPTGQASHSEVAQVVVARVGSGWSDVAYQH